MTVAELAALLAKHEPTAVVRFSIDNSDNPDPEERIFVEDGVRDHWGDTSEVTLFLVGQSNYSQ